MTDSQAALLALFARSAYGESVAIPNTWTALAGFSDLTSNKAFEAVLFSTADRSQIVISFRGTDSDLRDWAGANLALIGVVSDWDYQFRSALELTEAVKRAYPQATTLVAGHSLGGSLAQVAAAMFGLDGAAFAPAGAANIVRSTEFGSLAADWKITKEDPWTPGSDFTNYVVGGSLIGTFTLANVGKDVLIAVDVAEAVKLSVLALAAPPWVGLLIEGYIQAETLHARDRIAEYMVARADGKVAEYFEVRAKDALVAAQSGDYGMSSQIGVGGTSSWFGSDDPNYFFTDNGDNAILGFAGDDQIYAYAGNDTVDAGSGNDLVSTAQGSDVIDGGAGNDVLLAGSGDDTADGGAGNDIVDGGSGKDTIAVIAGLTEMDTVHGGTESDTLTVDASGITNATNIFWSRVTVDGQLARGVDSTSSFQAIKAYLGTAAGPLMLSVGATSWGVMFDGIENLSITAPTTESNTDLLIALGTGGSYDGKGGVDTFYADWSSATAGITWLNDPTRAATVNGATVAGVERLLLQTGNGNDSISNTDMTTSDEIITGAGDDVINTGAGSDTVDGGRGRDTIAVIAGLTEMDTVHGGTESDTLTVDASGTTNATNIFWSRVTVDGQLARGVDSTSSFQAIKAYLGTAAGPLMLSVGATSWGVMFDGIENLSITAPTTESNTDLLIALGTGGSYDGKGGVDTFYADWSSATAGITWINDPARAATVNGATVAGVERLLLQTGSGSDRISNALVNTDDEIHAGAGNDWIYPGAGTDRVLGDAGRDVVVFDDARSAHSITRSGATLTVTSRTGGTDTLLDVERVQFPDISLAFDIDGNAGRVARIIGAVLGTSYFADEAIVGLGLELLDGGMSYAALVDAAVGSSFFAELAGSHLNADFVRTVYYNVVGSPPSEADITYFTGLLESGSQTQASLALLACDLNLTATNVNLAGLGTVGIEYIPWAG